MNDIELINEWQGNGDDEVHRAIIMILLAVAGATYAVRMGSATYSYEAETAGETPTTIAEGLAARLASGSGWSTEQSGNSITLTGTSPGVPIADTIQIDSIPNSTVSRHQAAVTPVPQTSAYSLPPTTTGGTYTLSFNGGFGTKTTAAITYNATEATIKSALETADPNAVVTVQKSGERSYRVTWGGTYTGRVVNMTANAAALTGNATVEIAMLSDPSTAVPAMFLFDLPTLPGQVIIDGIVHQYSLQEMQSANWWSGALGQPVSNFSTRTIMREKDQRTIILFAVHANPRFSIPVVWEYDGTYFPGVVRQLRNMGVMLNNCWQYLPNITWGQTFTFDGQTTPAFQGNPQNSGATRVWLETELAALSSIGAGNVRVHQVVTAGSYGSSSGQGGPVQMPYLIEFTGAKGNSTQPLLTTSANGPLSIFVPGGPVPNTIARATVHANGGTYRLAAARRTAAWSYAMDSASVESDLLRIYGAGNVAITGTGQSANPYDPYVVEFIGELAGVDMPLIQGSPNVTATKTQTGARLPGSVAIAYFPPSGSLRPLLEELDAATLPPRLAAAVDELLETDLINTGADTNGFNHESESAAIDMQLAGGDIIITLTAKEDDEAVMELVLMMPLTAETEANGRSRLSYDAATDAVLYDHIESETTNLTPMLPSGHIDVWSRPRHQFIITATAGSFTLSNGVHTTSALTYTDPTAFVGTLESALSGMFSGVAVTGQGSSAAPYIASYTGSVTPELTANVTNLYNGSINTIQQITVDGTHPLTHFYLYVPTPWTTPLAWNASPATIKDAWEALDLIGVGNVLVSREGTSPPTYSFEFIGDLAGQSIHPIQADSSNLTGGSIIQIAIAQSAVIGRNEIHAVRIDPFAVGGTYRAVIMGRQTAALSHNAGAPEWQTQVDLMFGANVISVTRAGEALLIEYGGPFQFTAVPLLRLEDRTLQVSASTVIRMELQQGRGVNSWNNPTNWTRGHVPNSGEIAVIGSGSTPILYGLRQAGRLFFAVDANDPELVRTEGTEFLLGQIVKVSGRLADGTAPDLPAAEIEEEPEDYDDDTPLVVVYAEPVIFTSQGKPGQFLKLAKALDAQPLSFTDAGDEEATYDIGVRLKALQHYSRYSGSIGFPRRETSGAWVTWTRFLRLRFEAPTDGRPNCEIGIGPGTGIKLLRLDAGPSALDARVIQSQAGTEPAVQLLVDNIEAAQLLLINGQVGLGIEPTEYTRIQKIVGFAGSLTFGNVDFRRREIYSTAVTLLNDTATGNTVESRMR